MTIIYFFFSEDFLILVFFFKKLSEIFLFLSFFFLFNLFLPPISTWEDFCWCLETWSHLTANNQILEVDCKVSQLFGLMTSKHQILQVSGILFSWTLSWRNEPAWSILGALERNSSSCPLRADSHFSHRLRNPLPPASHKGSLFPASLCSRCTMCLTCGHEPHADRDSCQCGSTGDGKLTQSVEIPWQYVLCLHCAAHESELCRWQFHVTVSKGLCLSTK